MKRAGRESLLSIYWLSAVVTLVMAAIVGFGAGVEALATLLTLSILEITFSFDNAVVNATVLQHMTRFWQRMFMTVGILIGVFGVRLVLPLILVAVTAHLDIAQVVRLALTDPTAYAADLQAAHPTIAAFGGIFLLLIFLDYLSNFDWLSKHISRRHPKVFRFAPLLLALAVLGAVYITAASELRQTVLLAGLAGAGAYAVVQRVSSLFAKPKVAAVGRGGLLTFLYLELLDASFSFDGVIGAFAITSNVLLIAAGLGLGAAWVRSMTIHLVRRKVLKRYKYVDAGAHLAILALSATLLLGISFDLPGEITGAAGLVIVGLSFLASIGHNRRVRRRQ